MFYDSWPYICAAFGWFVRGGNGRTEVSATIFGKFCVHNSISFCSFGFVVCVLMCLQRSTTLLHDTDVIHIADYTIATQSWDRVNKIILSATQRGVIYDQLGKHKLNNNK
jgi:hypothetical protein